MPSEATPAEYMVVALARNLRDGEWAACGAYSEIPMAALRLARHEHAPNLWWMSGGGGAINSHCALVASSSSYETHRGAEAVFTIEEVVDFEFGGWRRITNVGLFGGIQVDRCGNVNMVGLGAYPRLRLRGPGTVGLAFAAHFHRTMIYLHDHNPRVLCEQVDYVSAPGHSASRAEHVEPHSRGPQLVVTPQAVFGFTPAGIAELRSITPGYGEADVSAHTGFDFAVADDLGETPAPTREQLALIREQIDPHGRLDRVKLGRWS
jgi:glutaconate CoA-transferase, subunit B